MKLYKYLFLFIFFCWHDSASWAAQKAPDAARAKEELQQLRNRIEALQKQITGAEASRNEAADALRESERAISEANRELTDLEQSHRSVSQRAEALRGESEKVSGTLAGQQALLARLVYQQHVQHAGTQPETLRILFGSENPNAAARELIYLGYVSRARADAIRDLRGNLANLKSLGDEAAAKAAELAAIAAEQVAQRKRLQDEKARHAEVLTRLARDITRQRQEVGTLQRNESRLTRLVDELTRIVRAPAKPLAGRPREKNERLPEPLAGAFSKLRGQLALPVRGELTGRFGSPRSDGGLTWKGLFLAARGGEAVRAVATGRVVYADWLRGFGNLLIIDHGEGYMSLYGYNETLLKRVGDDVRGGDPVAHVGASGGSGDSGLYFELRHQGKPFDPMTWMAARQQ